MARVLVVAAQPVLEHSIWIPGGQPDAGPRTVIENRIAGGSAIRVAGALAAYGTDVHLVGLVGRRDARTFEAFAARKAITHDLLPSGRETLTRVTITDETADAPTQLQLHPAVLDETECDALADRVDAALAPDGWLVLAEPLDGTLAQRLTAIATARGARLALVAECGEVASVLVRPAPGPPSTPGGVVAACDGEALVFGAAQDTVRAHLPPVAVISTEPARDALLAGALAGVDAGLPLTGIARLAAGFVAAAISAPGAEVTAMGIRARAAAATVDGDAPGRQGP